MEPIPKPTKIILALLRIALGCLFFYSGITKVLDPNWSAAGLLLHASNFQDFYHWLAGGQLLDITNTANSWGQLLLGFSLISGAFVRLSTRLGALLMLLYYLPLPFPKPDAHSYIVDMHIVYGLALLLLGSIRAGRIYGVDGMFAKWLDARKWRVRYLG